VKSSIWNNSKNLHISTIFGGHTDIIQEQDCLMFLVLGNPNISINQTKIICTHSFSHYVQKRSDHVSRSCSICKLSYLLQ
ncbi:hypothetical protein ACHAXS_006539, partial [Conticribra weissflogii]